MQRTLFVILCLFILFACHDKSVSSSPKDKGASPQKPVSKELVLKSAPARVYFGTDCSEAVLKEICEARSNIFVQAHSLPSAAVIGALIDARKGGLEVEVITGRGPRKAKNSPATSLANAGIPVYIDSKRAIGRDETIVIDGKTVVAGSFDCSSDTEKLTVIRSPELATVYMKNGKKGKQHAKAYRSKVTPAPAAQRTVVRKRKP